jgi:hypothetical protein
MLRTPVHKLAGRLNAPLYALPLDICRIVTGLVCLAYFGRELIEAPDFTDVNGLIDHALSNEVFPFTRIGLFHAGMSLLTFQTVFMLALLCAVGVIVGYRPKLSAAVLYVIAVSTYRWHFLVIYVDDAIVHLMLFWMVLLPIGRTLVLYEWVVNRRGAWNQWKSETVPGAPVRCFVANIALIYLVAGLWKWTSPMWRSGTAVYAILKTPIALTPEYWGLEHLWFLVPLNYLALFCEPLFPLVWVLRGRSILRTSLLIALAAFHIFILMTMRLPFANMACLGAAAVLAHDDLILLFRLPKAPARAPAAAPVFGTGGLAFSFVVVLTLAMLSSVSLPNWRKPTGTSKLSNGTSLTSGTFLEAEASQVEGLGNAQLFFFSALWTIGIAQQYQLLNWIDQRNFMFKHSAIEVGSDGVSHSIDPRLIFPATPRSALLQSYLHGMVWNTIPAGQQSRLRESLKRRFAARYCRSFPTTGIIVVDAGDERTGIGSEHRSEPLSRLMAFSCQSGAPVFAE